MSKKFENIRFLPCKNGAVCYNGLEKLGQRGGFLKERHLRTARLIGEDGVLRLENAHVAVFGLGGVGGSALEALCRAGVGELSLFDGDCVSESNLNRQIIANVQTVGMKKVLAAEKRLLEINPDIKLNLYDVFYTLENSHEFDLSQYDYIIDAVDMVSAKIELAVRAKEAGVPLISSMGTGNKLNAAALEVADIFKTSVCPLARVMRRELKERGVKKLKVVYSREEPITPKDTIDTRTPASLPFVPNAAGLILAGEVVRELIG